MQGVSKLRLAFFSAVFAAMSAMVLAVPTAFASDFPDVPDGHWAEVNGIIDRAVDEGVMAGYDDGRFGPDDPVTRAQVAVMLARISGADLPADYPADATGMKDVESHAWYTAAMNWAVDEGVYNGSDGYVRPNDPISRQELAVVLANYWEMGGSSTASDQDRLGKYSDGAACDSWAKEGVSWAVEQGVMGAGDAINPHGGATRAETAKMVLVVKDGGDEQPALLKAHYIDVGQGDSCFVELSDGQTMLIDAGTAEYGQAVVDYVRDLGYGHIDHVVATHPDADHIGGMVDVLNAFSVGTFYMPDCVSTTKTYESMVDALASKGVKVVEAKAGGQIVKSGDLNAWFVGPVAIQSGATNENSAVIWMSYGGKTFYFTGDADADDLANAALGHVDVLKVSHHGSNTGTDSALVNKTTPSNAVISVGAGNSYGHPTENVLKLLADTNVYRTDQQGTVSAYTDTDEVWFGASPTGPWTPPVVVPEPEPEPQPPAGPDMNTTVCVTKSGSKYHYDWCSTLKRSTSLTYMPAWQAVQNGYGACKVCNPPA